MTMTPRDRDTLARLAALMIPGSAGMPSADALRLAGAPCDKVLALAPHLCAPLERFCGAAHAVRDMSGLEAAAQADLAGFEAVSTVLANAYFMAPQVRQAIGYPGQEARDSSTGLGPDDMALLAPVRQRGRLWRAP